MPTDSTMLWESLEQRHGTALLVGGGLLLVNAVVHGASAFGELSTSPELRGVLFGVGFAVIFAGLLGLYPGVSDRSPRLARGAAAATAGAVIFNAVNAVWWVGVVVAPSIPGPGEVTPLAVLTMIAMLLGFVLFGLASARTAVPSKAVGRLLLLTPVVAVAAVLLRGFVLVDLPQGSGGFLFLGVTALMVLATGYVLHTAGGPSDSAEPSPESAA